MRLLIQGVDTLYLAVDVADRSPITQVESVLAEAKAKAKVSIVPEVRLGDRVFFCKPRGRSGYEYVLVGSGFDLRLGADSDYIPAIYAEFRADYLWEKGLEGAVSDFEQFLKSWGVSPLLFKVSRVDYALDYKASYEEVAFSRSDVVTRFKRFSVYGSQDTLKEGFETFTLGKGDVVLRIYDKAKEVKNSGKFWFYDLWHTEEDVWRVEFQFRRRFLRDFSIERVEDLKERLGDLLLYMVFEHTRINGSDGLHPLWVHLSQDVANVRFQGYGRGNRVDMMISEKKAHVLNTLLGYLTSYAALEGIETGEVEDVELVASKVARAVKDMEASGEYDYVGRVVRKMIEVYKGVSVW